MSKFDRAAFEANLGLKPISARVNEPVRARRYKVRILRAQGKSSEEIAVEIGAEVSTVLMDLNYLRLK